MTPEPLICSYPGSAVETPNEVFDDGEFQLELANFLSHPSAIDSDYHLPPSGHPQYINTLLNAILQDVGRADDVSHVTKSTTLLTSALHGFGRTADVSRIIKRVRDHVGRSRGSSLFLEPSDEVEEAWRRSPLWLLIRVAIRVSVNRSLGPAYYKRFMLFFMCNLARDESNTSLSSDLLHLMSCKILRRFGKLDSSTSHWPSEMALGTWTCLRKILDARWEQLNARVSPFRNPSQDELTRDTHLSLLDSQEYIRNTLANLEPQLLGTPFRPNHCRRGTIEDFLSSNGTFFDETYHADPDVTLYDVEQSVEQGIDDWIACVTDVDEACIQLETLMDKYMMKAYERRWTDPNPEDMSTRLLTGIELYIALDKLAVKEIPLLVDYHPEIPIAFLEKLLLRKTTSLHRLSCAYQYLSVRHAQSRSGWSVFSDEFTEDSFPVRYYDQSPHLQQLKARVEQDTMKECAEQALAGSQLEGASLGDIYDGYQRYQQHLPEPTRKLPEVLSSLPALPLHAKVVVFELQCPTCIRAWRSAVPRILHNFRGRAFDSYMLIENNLPAGVPALRPYFINRQGSPLRFQVHFAYFYPEYTWNDPILRYVVQEPELVEPMREDWFLSEHTQEDRLWHWRQGRIIQDKELSWKLRYDLDCQSCPSCRDLAEYVDFTSHTSNDVLSAQADCPADLSLDEFIMYAQLRSGGSLQWLNLLQGLRSRTLNLRRHQVHFLVAHAAFQVGPLDLDTGAWIWHQELQDSCFCNTLLDELDSLIVDVGAHSIDGVLMSTISLLLTRVLSSSPGEGVSNRVITLLRSVRKKSFGWVQDLSYDLAQAPTNEERMNLLMNMAVTCRSTFDSDPATLRKLFHSAEDVDALLSCAFFIHALRPKGGSNS